MIDKVIEMIYKIYDNGEIPEDLYRSIFIAMLVKLAADESERHQAITIKSQISKLTIRILVNRSRIRIISETDQEECNFV